MKPCLEKKVKSIKVKLEVKLVFDRSKFVVAGSVSPQSYLFF